MMTAQLVKTPIYQQLNEALRDLIRNGEFSPDDQFLTERQICERFEVSRATANKALSNLVAEGIVAFKKGVGTFVRSGVLDYDLRALVSFTDKARAAGKVPSTRVLAFRSLPAVEASLDAAERLRLGERDDVYAVERLRLADDIPMILEKRVIAARHCPNLTADDLGGSLYALWTETYGLDITGADQTIRAVTIGDADSRLLAVESGAPGLLVSSLGTLAGGAPLWWEQTLYRGDAYEFQNRLGPIQTARPATPMMRDMS
jgi:GntR family transcriptional regulator